MAEQLDRGEFLAGYLAEVNEHIEAANRQLLDLDVAIQRQGPQLRMIRELFRALHTIKGLSAMVGVEPVVQIAHEMEALFRLRDRTASPLNGPAVELLLRAMQAIEGRVQSVGEGRAPEPAAPELLAGLRRLHGGPALGERAGVPLIALPPELAQKLSPAEREQLGQGLASGLSAVRLDFAPSPALAGTGVSITTVRERLGRLCEIVKVVPQSVPKSERAPGGLNFVLLVLTRSEPDTLIDASELPTEAISASALDFGAAPAADEGPPIEPLDDAVPQVRDTIRVEVARLDEALDRLGSLVVTRMRLERATRTLRENGVDTRDLEVILGEHRRDLTRLRSALTHARMVSVQQLLERVPLLVRRMASETGKDVSVVIDAGKAELDKAVAERVFPALMHLIRNAVDHAIEPVEVRERLGKPAHGTVTVRCFERPGNRLELSVSDDGAGIDREKVAKKAGCAVPDDDRALLSLLTIAGLSTRDVANARSGRGMGMDIVKRVAVDVLGGELRMTTRENEGTTFGLRLPMSITIVDSFMFRCGGQSFAVPLAAIDEIVDLSGERVARAPEVRGTRRIELLRRRGENIPLFDLASLFAIQARPGLKSALLIERDGERYAFSVDHMLGQQEVVVRPLEDPLVKVPGVTGSTDLGDGRPTLVLDLWALTRMIAERPERSEAAS